MSISLYVTIGIICLILFLAARFHRKWTGSAVVQGPPLLTMIGIGGTFFGIAAGLFTFNANDIQDSIPGLIDGMRTAVWASFFGVAFAISIKWRDAFSPRQQEAAETTSDVEVIGALIASKLDQLHRALCGDHQASVLSQMQLARRDMNDGMAAVESSMNACMERLTELSSKALVEALRDVIHDFNQNLTDQFGENFKELNSAIYKLVDWQEHYRDQLDNLIAIEKESANSLRDAVTQHEAALAASGSLLVVADGFKDILSAADGYKATLRQSTAALAGVLATVSGELPEIRKSILSLVTSVSDAVGRHEADIAALTADIGERFSAAADAVQTGLTTALAGANKEVSDHITRLVGSTKEQSEAMQAMLEDALNTSMSSLAQQLASLSNRFAQDYGPLADRLRDIVQIGSAA